MSAQHIETLPFWLAMGGFWPTPEQTADTEPLHLRQCVEEALSEMEGQHLLALTWVAAALSLLGAEDREGVHGTR